MPQICEDILDLKPVKGLDKYSKEFFEIYNQLNNLLFDIYGFEEYDRRLINEILKEGMSKKQNG